MPDFLVQPGKAYFPIDYRAVVFSYATETARALIDVGYTASKGFVARRAAISGPAHGYFLGGSQAASLTAAKIRFLENTSSAMDLTRRHPRSLGSAHAYAGFAFGATTINEDRQGIFVDKIAFATDAISATGSLLSPAGSYQSAMWSQVVHDQRAAFLRSGPNSDRPHNWSEYDMYTGTHQVIGAPPPENNQSLGVAVSSPTAGYVPIHPAQAVEKLSFATKTATVSQLVLSPGVTVVAAAPGYQKGYLVGSDGRTRAISFLVDTEVVVSTALQDTSGAAVVSAI